MLSKCSESIVKCKKSVYKIKSLPAILEQKGKYKFKSNLNWCPKNDGEIALTINTMNCLLDFDDFFMKQTDKTKSNCIAILINSKGQNISNIQIRNGSIIDFSMYCIVVLGSTQNIAPLVSNIWIHHINFVGSGYDGIDLWQYGSSGIILMTEATIDNSPASPPQNILVEDCQFNDNYTANPNSGGFIIFGFGGSNNVVLRKNIFNNNTAIFTESSPNVGYMFMSFFSFDSCNGIEVTDSVISGSSVNYIFLFTVFTTFFGSNFKIDGLRVYNTSLPNISGEASGWAGIELGGTDTASITNCVFQGLTAGTATNPSQIAEFVGLVACTDIIIDNNTFQNLQCNGVPVAAVAVHSEQEGPTLIYPSSHVQVTNNKIQEIYNLSTSFLPSTTYFCAGVAVYNILGYAGTNSDIIVKGNKIQNVSFPGGSAGGFVGAAIFAGNAQGLTTDENQISGCDNGIVLVVQPETGIGVFQSSVEENTVVSCSDYGFYDSTQTQPFIKNKAKYNGINYSVATNTPIINWDPSIPAPPAINPDLDNISIN